MPPHNLPDWAAIGARVALARNALKLTQADFAARVELDRSSLSRIESGNRHLSALELAALARVTDLPIDWFVMEAAPAVASRRSGDIHDSTIVDLRLETLTREVAQLIDLNLLRPSADVPKLNLPSDVDGAEEAARQVRARLGNDAGPLTDLASAAESLGVLAYSLPLSKNDADGAYASIHEGLGVALLNGSRQPSARRRFTLAHEIGHHVFQDAYAIDGELTGRSESERIIDAFAVHLLLPRPALKRRWRELNGDGEPRSAAIVIGAEYRLSWTALCGHLVNVGVLDRQQGDAMRAALPRGGEYAELGVAVIDELAPPMAPRSVAQAALRGYRTHRLGAGRTLELLHGTLTEEDLPEREEIPLAALAGDLRSA